VLGEPVPCGSGRSFATLSLTSLLVRSLLKTCLQSGVPPADQDFRGFDDVNEAVRATQTPLKGGAAERFAALCTLCPELWDS